MSKRILLRLLALVPALLMFVPAKSADLQLTPSVCAVEEGEGSCDISVKVDFVADDDTRYCLTIVGKGLVRCFWGNSDEFEVYINSSEDLQFQITESESGEGVAAAIFKVAHYEPKRHRRRYGWGLL